MGYTTKISDYELARGDGPPPCEGVDIEAERESSAKRGKSTAKSEDEKPVTTSKVVEPEKKTPAKKSTARTKSK